MNFSILILTLNEQVNLPACLESVAFCDDIVVLDSRSTDQTVEIAEQAGVRVYTRAFDDFASQRNFALDEIEFKYPWVFQLDADERFTPELAKECEKEVANDLFSGYFVPSKLMFKDHWLRWSGCYPVYQVRLVKPGEIRFIQSGHGQRESEPKRGLGRLTSPYLHFNFSKGMDDWYEKHQRYAQQEARQSIGQTTNGDARWSHLFRPDAIARRRAVKSISACLPFRPTLRFFYNYVCRGGFMDGGPGYEYCRLLSTYEKMIVKEIKALKRQGH